MVFKALCYCRKTVYTKISLCEKSTKILKSSKRTNYSAYSKDKALFGRKDTKPVHVSLRNILKQIRDKMQAKALWNHFLHKNKIRWWVLIWLSPPLHMGSQYIDAIYIFMVGVPPCQPWRLQQETTEKKYNYLKVLWA